MLRWKFEIHSLFWHIFKNGCPEENAEKPKIKISVSQYLIITDIHNLSLDICFWGWQIWWYYLKIRYISKRTSKSMMAANFGQKIVISMKSTNMPVSILPKTKSFKVLCVFVPNYGVNNEKSEMHGLPGVLKMLTMEKSKKPESTISVRQLLFIIDLYHLTLNNDIIHYQ